MRLDFSVIKKTCTHYYRLDFSTGVLHHYTHTTTFEPRLNINTLEKLCKVVGYKPGYILIEANVSDPLRKKGESETLLFYRTSKEYCEYFGKDFPYTSFEDFNGLCQAVSRDKLKDYRYQLPKGSYNYIPTRLGDLFTLVFLAHLLGVEVSNVSDLGCGLGSAMVMLKLLTPKVHGVELEPKYVELSPFKETIVHDDIMVVDLLPYKALYTYNPFCSYEKEDAYEKSLPTRSQPGTVLMINPVRRHLPTTFKGKANLLGQAGPIYIYKTI